MSTWFETWTGLALRQPWWGVVLFAFALAAWGRWRAGAPALPFAPLGLLDKKPLPGTWRTRCHLLPAVLLGIAAVAASIAVMRPVQRIELPAVRQGIDIVLCLDVSSSMAVVDLDDRRDRLTVARAAAAAFVANRPDDRIGLVRFARFPDLVCPPTLDHAALAQFLAELQLVERDGTEDATGIGTAIARSVQVLAESAVTARVVILVTDGEENVAAAGIPDAIGPLQAAQLAARHGVKVHALAVGGTAPGRPAIDTSQIDELAQRTGGRFFAAQDAAGMSLVYRAIDQLERTGFATARDRYEERYRPFVLAALLALLAATLLRRTCLQVLA